MRRDFVVFVLGYAAVHCFVFFSVFDVYFTTPVVSNIKPLEWSNVTAADRLVLFVSDGLRADKFFELDNQNKTRSPFLRQVILHNGTWGVSHTRPPTESRPAHVAMLGGFYEDPSALRLFWKDNPVEFDTVLNRSRITWAWGAPDVLVFFNKGSAESHVHIDCHNYAVADLSRLDVWVFEKVKNFFLKARSDESLHSRLMQNKIIFFLHLAGVDSNGHRYHPDSSYYLANIKVIDTGIKEIVSLFEDFYEDKKTAYIFTADHGMSDAGGHGGGHETEVLTPFIAWGAGVRHLKHQEKKPILSEHEISRTRKWGLNSDLRVDISQIDISVLMAAMIGVPFPVNSDGKIPLTYLGSGEAEITQQVLGRLKQLAEQYLTKRNLVKEHSFYLSFFQEYRYNDQLFLKKNIEDIQELVSREEFENAIDVSDKLFNFVSDGIQYYKFYHRCLIRTSVVASLIGSMAGAMVLVMKQKFLSNMKAKQKWNTKLNAVFLVVAFIFGLRLIVLQAPWRYYLYCYMPLFIWHMVLNQARFITHFHFEYSKNNSTRLLLYTIGCLVFLRVSISGFYNRQIFLSAIAIVWFVGVTKFKTKSSLLKLIWTGLCVCFMIFPMQTEILNEGVKKFSVLSGGICASILCGTLQFYHHKQKTSFSVFSYCIVFLPAITGCIAYSALQNSVFFGRTVIILSWIAPFFSKSKIPNRLLCLHAWHLSSYVILSLSYEAFYFVVLTALLHIWVLLEVESVDRKVKLPFNTNSCNGINGHHGKSSSLSKSSGSSPSVFDDVCRSCLLLFFLLIGFFGLFSVESLNHFHVRSLPFLPVTNRFALLCLTFYKVCLHYVSISVAFCSLQKVLKTTILLNWYITVILCDFMALHFYFWVRDSGSWAEMAFSIVNLGIPLGLPIVLLLLFLVGKLLICIKVPKRLQFC